MNVLLTLLVCGLALSAEGFPDIKDWNTVTIKLERGVCANPCPVYSVEVRGTGEIRYEGKSNVTVLGRHTDTVSRGQVEALLEPFRHAEFFNLNSAYGTDPQTVVLTVSVDGATHSIADRFGAQAGMPDIVLDLEQFVDFYGQTVQWVFGENRTVPALQREGFDFRSEEAGRMLARAAYQGDSSVVRDLINAGAPLGVPDQLSCTFALICAVHNHNVEVLRLLMAAGASNSIPAVKATALAQAMDSRRQDAERLLREYGAGAAPDVRDWSSVRILLERSSCFGSCPDYSVEVTGSGEVRYEGRFGVAVTGAHRSNISPNAVRELIQRFRSAAFFAWANQGRGGIMLDAPRYKLSVTVDGITTISQRYKGEPGIPAIIADLENAVDEVAGVCGAPCSQRR